MDIPKPAGYTRRNTMTYPPLVLPVPLYNPETNEHDTVTLTCKHVRMDEYQSLSDLVTLDYDQRKTSGERELSARRTKLKAVVQKLEGCADFNGGDIGAYLDMPGNEDLCWVGWAVFAGALEQPGLFRPAGDRGEAGRVPTEGTPEDSSSARA